MIELHILASGVLASGESKKSGPIALAVILVLCVACYFLFKSMSGHLRKVREEYPAGGASGARPPADDAAEPSSGHSGPTGPSSGDQPGDAAP